MQDSDLATLGILIVEDEPLLRKQMMADLEKQGADVTGADTLQRAKKAPGESRIRFCLSRRELAGRPGGPIC